MSHGFLGTQASLTADVVLLLEIVMGVGLLAGAWLARAKRFRQHAWCQSAIVLLNLTVTGLTMAPSFRTQVLPRIPARLSMPYFALATAHAALGSVAELAALYILLAAGTRLLPEKLRLNRYRLWMRTVLALWWLVLLLGFATYARWYVPNSLRSMSELGRKPRVVLFELPLLSKSSFISLYPIDSTHVIRHSLV